MLVRVLALAVSLAVLTGCGSSGGGAASGDSSGGGQPGAGKPVVRLATKNFTEQFILGELYKQALEAKGFKVEVKQDVGSSELVDEALKSGTIDMYPEYIGVIVTELADQRDRPQTAEDTYRRARAFESDRGFDLLARTPGVDALANAVLPAYARKHHLRSADDLRKLGAFRYGGPPENQTRFQGALGMKMVYGLDKLRYVPLEISERYDALDRGKVDVTQVFTSEGQLAEKGRYVVLADPKNIFGFQNIAPVVNKKVIKEQGPAFAKTLDSVSQLLTNDALRTMNGDVDLRGEKPAEVATKFLQDHQLL